ncbi:alcohol dehydrogenase catalytic domain-containing protein [Streptomyces tendae]
MPGPDAPLELRRFSQPELEPGAILLRTLGSEVCGTDAHLWKGQLAGMPYPTIPGHVSVGQITALGPVDVRGELAKDVSGVPPGSGAGGDVPGRVRDMRALLLLHCRPRHHPLPGTEGVRSHVAC